MKLGPVTKLNKWNTLTSQKIGDDVMSANMMSLFFPIYYQFAAIQKPDSGRFVDKTYISINSNLLPYKSWKQN